jgi:hypothetical protein
LEKEHFHVRVAKEQKIKFFYTTYKFIDDKPLSCSSSKKAKKNFLLIAEYTTPKN